jgi:hypothetical protein
MAPRPAATAAPARRHAHGSPSRRWGRGAGDGAGAASPAIRRARLRVVPPGLRQNTGTGPALWNRTRLLTVLAVTSVVGALLAVVVGQALLANGQVRLTSLQQDLALEQSAHRQSELSVAELETPARIVAAAGQLHMVRPDNVIELPYVSLQVPLPTPTVTPAPAPPPAPAPAAATASGSATGSGSAAATATTTTTTPTATPTTTP